MGIHFTFDETLQSAGSWFSATVVRNTVDPHAGAGCLSWTANDFFSGIENTDYPYTPHGEAGGTTVRPKVWVKGVSGTYDTSLTWLLHWTNDSGAVVVSESAIEIPVSSEWAEFIAPTDLVVPVGSTRLHWQMATNTAAPGSVILIDELSLEVPQDEQFWEWDGSDKQPVTLLGWWDGADVQPLLDPYVVE